MKKTLILSAFPAIILAMGLFAYTSASAQDYYDSYGSGGYGGFDSGYGSSYDSYGSGYSGYDGGYGSSYGGSSVYDSYGTGGYGSFDSYGSGYSGYDQYGCGSDCYGGSSYSSYGSSYGCGSSCYGGSSYSSGCGSSCYGGGFTGYSGGFTGYSGGMTVLPPVYVPPRYNPPVVNPPVYNPPVYNPPVYNPPVYNPPTYNPPVYNPPTYNPPVYYPPPVYQPPLVCSIRFSNFNPPLAAVEGQLWTYGLQAISTGSYSNQISYRLVSGPDGMIVLPNGQIAWTPAFNQGRSTGYTVTVAAYNGSCENSQTFYVTVHDMNPVPPPVYHPQPKPACTCACNACPPVQAACTTTTTTVTTTCAPVKPLAPQYGVCPPTATGPAVASTEPTMPNSGVGSASGFSVTEAAGAASAGLFAALAAMLYSPWLLLAVIIILAILLARAYQRTRAMTVAI